MFLKSSVIPMVLLATSGLLGSCGDDDHHGNDWIEVRVVSGENEPVAGAKLEGGFDWDWYSVTTDQNGMALLPAWATRHLPTITAANHFPFREEFSLQSAYQLMRTRLYLTQEADIDGDLIKSTTNEFCVVSYQGAYRHYRVDGDEVILQTEAQMAMASHDRVLRNDSLWRTTHDSGVFVYDISEMSNPRQVMHLPIPGYLWAIALDDSILYLADPWVDDSVRAYTWSDSSTYELVGTFGPAKSFSRLFMHRGALFGVYFGGLIIWDVSEPAAGVQRFGSAHPYTADWCMRGDSLVLIPLVPLCCDDYYGYQILDVSDPMNPVWGSTFHSNGLISRFINDSVAVGTYAGQGALLEYDRSWERFNPSAIIYHDYDPTIRGERFLTANLVVLEGAVWRIAREWPQR